MKSAWKTRIALLTALVLLGGCLFACQSGSSETTETAPEETSPAETAVTVTVYGTAPAERITETLTDSISIDAVPEISTAVDFSQLSVYSGTARKLDFEKAKELLLAGKTITSEKSSKTAESYTGSDHTLCLTLDGSMLSSCGEDLSFSCWTDDRESLDGAVNYAIDPAYESCSACINGDDLAFASIEEAEADIFAFLDEMQIPYTSDIICYTLPKDTLTELYREQNELYDDSGEVSEDALEDCYYFLIPVAVEGVPLSQGESGVYADGTNIYGSPIQCVYTKDGIVGFYLDYSYEVTGTEETAEGIDLSGALELLKQADLSEPCTITSIKLEYVPVAQNGDKGTVQLVPVWRFSGTRQMDFPAEKGKDACTVDLPYSILFNAITGEEMPVDNGGI